MPQTSTTQVPSAVSVYLDQKLLSRAYPLFVHTRWAQVRDIPRNSSEVIKFRKYGSLSAATTALTEGTTPTGSALSITDITATALQLTTIAEVKSSFISQFLSLLNTTALLQGN